MILSMELGKNRIYAVLWEENSVAESFTIEVPAVEENRIGEAEECAQCIRAALEEHKVKVKQCLFVLPSMMAVTKEMNAPKNLSDKDLSSYVSTNLSSVMEIDENEYVTDCIFLNTLGGEMDTVLGIVLKREILDKCLTIAKMLSMHCLKVDLRMNVVYKYFKTSGWLKETACLAARLEDKWAEIDLFEENHLFVRTTELIGGGGQEADSLLKNWAVSFNDTLLASEEQAGKTSALIDQLANLRNFQISRNRQRPVETIYLYGEVDQAIATEVEQVTSLPVRLPMAETGQSLFAIAIMAAAEGEKTDTSDLDLLTAMKRRTPKELAKRTLNRLLAGAVGVTVLVCLLFSLGLVWNNSRLTKEINTVQDYLSSAEMVSKAREAGQVQRQLVAQRQYNKVLRQFNEAFMQQFRYDSYYIHGVLGLASTYGVVVSYYDYNEEVLNMTCTAQNSSIAAEFSKKIEQQDLAADVTFVGYEKQDNEGSANYVFQIKGTIKEMP